MSRVPKGTILTIDDELIVRQSLVAYLEDCGYRMLQAESGRAGLDIFRREKPDLLIVDLRMPEIDGLDLLSVVSREAPETPTIVVSGTGVLQDAVEAVRRGAWDFVTKPIHDMAVLEHAVERALEQAHLRRENRQYRERLEDEVARRTQELESARNEAEAASAAKSQFLANMSHELRTPLNGIIGLTDLLMGVDMSPDQVEYLSMIKQAGRELLAIVNNLLDMSSIEARRLVLREANFSLRDCISEVVRVLEVQARWKNLELTFSVDPDVPQVLAGDSGRVKQVVSNLVVNAIKYTEKGGIAIRVKLADADNGQFAPVTTGSDGSSKVSVAIEVKDTGVGIPVNKFGQVFEPFALAECFMTKKYGGAGLGLAISREIARKMEGDIALESKVGKGSCFTFFARFTSSEPLGVSDGEHGVPMLDGFGRKLRILLAEDDIINRKLAMYFFQKQGHHVTCVSNGVAVLEALVNESFDFVLMDIQMPDMDGVEATKAIRSARTDDINTAIPIIAMTAHAMKGDRERFLEAGMDDYISKPVDFARLVEVVTRVLKR